MSTATAVDYRDEDFAQSVLGFRIDVESESLNAMQQDGATAIVDLAGEYESMGCSVLIHCSKPKYLDVYLIFKCAILLWVLITKKAWPHTL